MKKLSQRLMIAFMMFSCLGQPLTALADQIVNESEAVVEVPDASTEAGGDVTEEGLPTQPDIDLPPEELPPEIPGEITPPIEENKPEVTPEPPETVPEVKPTPEAVKPVEQAPNVPVAPEVIEQPQVVTDTSITGEVAATNEPAVSSGSMSFTKDQSTEAFILRLGKEARKIGQEKNIYASVMIAQAILESASGNSQLASEPNFNLFGIKGAYEGQSVNFGTHEDDGSGNLYMIDAGFKKYPSYKESLEDYGDLITKGIDGSPEFYKGTWKSDAKSYQEATQFLTGRYATDITYNQKLNGLIETYQLTRFDREETTTQAVTHPLPEGGTVSSHYGQRGEETHRGVDFAAPSGSPIVAIKSGVVVTSEFNSSWGEYVVVAHEDGKASLYAHQSQRLVKVGDLVEAGDILGLVGSTGDSTGPHLHVEISLDGSLSMNSLIDPLSILDH